MEIGPGEVAARHDRGALRAEQAGRDDLDLPVGRRPAVVGRPSTVSAELLRSLPIGNRVVNATAATPGNGGDVVHDVVLHAGHALRLGDLRFVES